MVGGVPEMALDVVVAEADAAPIDGFARLVLSSAGEASTAIGRALRFRAIAAVRHTHLWAGVGVTVAAGTFEIEGSGLLFLSVAGDGPVRLRLTVETSSVAAITLEEDGRRRSVEVSNQSVVTVEGRQDRPVAVRLEVPAGIRLKVALADVSTPAVDIVEGAVVWEVGEGFGSEEPAAPEFGLNQPFRWVESRRARLTFLNPSAGWTCLTLRLRTLMTSQRIMIRIGDEVFKEADIAGGDIRSPVSTSAMVWLDEGLVAVELVFSSWATTPDRNLSAIVESLALAPTSPPPSETVATWRDLDGYDFEEQPAPQFGLMTAFRWRLPGARIAVAGQAPGRHHVIIRYRSALPGQVLTASHHGVELARNAAISGRLDTDEVLAFDINYDGDPVEISLDADKYMEGERPLGFVIQSVSVEPML